MHIFHLAIPVSSLIEAKTFYQSILGAAIGRENTEWLDILLWGHQITLHQQPSQVLSLAEQGKRHFGVVLPWATWERLSLELVEKEVVFLKPPEVLYAGNFNEQAKMFLQDPSNNIIEIKAYRDFDAVFNVKNHESLLK